MKRLVVGFVLFILIVPCVYAGEKWLPDQVEYQGKIASASTWFNVTENKFLVVLRRNIVLISIIVLLLALIIYLIKRKKGKLKIFKSKGKRKRKHIGTLIAPKD